jgi:hypothetical protein
MNKVYMAAGTFFICAGGAGLVSYSAFVFPQVRYWAFWILVTVLSAFVVAAILDEYACQWLGIEYRAYLSLLVGVGISFLLGGLIQWR